MMLRRSRILQVTMGGISSLLLSSVSWGVQSYTLACKPGQGMNIYQRQTTGGLHVYFKRGSTAAVNGLAAGTCAWLDRGVGSNEPNTTCHNDVNDIHWAFDPATQKLTTMYSRNGQAPYLKDAFEGKTFYLKVYNNQSGCMVVTGSGL